MALIDFYNIDNWAGGEQIPWYFKLLPIASTLMGFALGLLPGLVSREKFKRRTGKLFKLELESLKFTLEEQLSELKKYKNEFLNISKPTDGIMTLSIVLLHKFEIIKTFDKIVLIKFYEKQQNELATHYISSYYQMFGVIERDTERLDKVYSEYQIEFERIGESYVSEINYLKALAIMERDKLGGDMSKDIVLSKLWDSLFSQNKNLNISEIMAFAKDLHSKFMKDGVFTDFKHPLYKSIIEFDLKGSRILSEYENKKAKYVRLLQMSEQTFQNALNDLENLR